MDLEKLDNLVKVGQLKQEPHNAREYAGLVSSGKLRLNDAKHSDLSDESRFDLAYNAAHSFALAALRRCGYRSNRSKTITNGRFSGITFMELGRQV